MLARAAAMLGLDADREALAEIAGRCRGTPRIANRLLRRVRDYALVHGGRDAAGSTSRRCTRRSSSTTSTRSASTGSTAR